MKEKKPEPAVHDLRDRPVPPVKGAILDRQDICPRPEHQAPRQSVDPENWM